MVEFVLADMLDCAVLTGRSGMDCHCQSGKEYASCCGRWLDQDQPAPRAVELMRSRYSAFVAGDVPYLLKTWHSQYRPAGLELDSRQRWIGLEIIDFIEQQGVAEVEFEARFLFNGMVQGIHERSRFVMQQKRWLYTDGDQLPLRFTPWKPGRNESCPCASGAKFKRCCGA